MTGFFSNAPLGKPSFPGVLLTDAEVEYRLNVAAGGLERHRDLLQRRGFPGPVAETGERWDAYEVNRWMQSMEKVGRWLPSPTQDRIADTIAELKRKAAAPTKPE